MIPRPPRPHRTDTLCPPTTLFRSVTDSVAFDGLSWSVIDRRAEKDPGNHALTMYTNLDDTLLVLHGTGSDDDFRTVAEAVAAALRARRSEEQTSELQSLMRTSYAVFCLKKKRAININETKNH